MENVFITSERGGGGGGEGGGGLVELYLNTHLKYDIGH